MTVFGNDNITIERLFGVTCWLAGLALILLACFEVLNGPYSVLGMAVIMASSLRAVLLGQRSLRTRESIAYDMGQESVRLLR